MADQLVTREEYVERYERWASRLRRAGVVLLLVFVVLVCLSWLLWGVGVAYRPVVHIVMLAWGFVLGVALASFVASLGCKLGIYLLRQREGYQAPVIVFLRVPQQGFDGEMPQMVTPQRVKQVSTYAVVGCAIAMLAVIYCLVEAISLIVSFDSSSLSEMSSEASDYPGGGFFWFGPDGLIEVLMSFCVGGMLGVIVILVWGIRQAVGWRRGSNPLIQERLREGL